MWRRMKCLWAISDWLLIRLGIGPGLNMFPYDSFISSQKIHRNGIILLQARGAFGLCELSGALVWQQKGRARLTNLGCLSQHKHYGPRLSIVAFFTSLLIAVSMTSTNRLSNTEADNEPSQSIINVPCQCISCEFGDFRSIGNQSSTSVSHAATYTQIEATEYFNTLASTIQWCSHALQELLQSHGDAIVLIWQKKSIKQREAALRKFDTTMCYDDHALSLDLADTRYPDENGHSKPERTNEWTYRFPYLNIQRLAMEPWRLIGLLYARATTHPSRFSVFDTRKLFLGWYTGVLPYWPLPGCVKMTEDDFAQLEELNIEKTHSGEAMSAPRAICILQSQQLLLYWLLGMSISLLGDRITGPDNKAPEWPSTDIGQFLSMFEEVEEIISKMAKTTCNSQGTRVKKYIEDCIQEKRIHDERSLAVRHEDLPFELPHPFQLDNIISMVQGRINEMQDDLWLYQTRPHDLARRGKTIAEKSTLQTRLDQLFGKTLTKLDYVPWMGIWCSITSYVDWALLLRELQHINDLRQRYADSIRPGQALPPEYATALSHVREMVNGIQSTTQMLIMLRATSLPNMRHFSQIRKNRPTPTSLKRGEALSKLLTDSRNAIKGDRLMCVFVGLLTPDNSQSFFTRNQTMSALSLLEKAQSEGSRIAAVLADPMVREWLSDFTILEHINSEIDLHDPMIPRITPEEALESSRPFWKLQKALGAQGEDISPQYTPFKSAANAVASLMKLSRPGTPQDSHSLRQRRRADSALKDVWTGIEQAVEEHITGVGIPDEAADLMRGVVQFYRDPKHQANIDTEYAALEHGFAMQREAHTAAQFGQLQITTPKATLPTTVSGKKKTRPQAVGRDAGAVPLQAAQTQPVHTPIVLRTLRDGDMKVIDGLLGHGTSKVRWNDFCHLLQGLGFEKGVS